MEGKCIAFPSSSSVLAGQSFPKAFVMSDVDTLRIKDSAASLWHPAHLCQVTVYERGISYSASSRRCWLSSVGLREWLDTPFFHCNTASTQKVSWCHSVWCCYSIFSLTWAFDLFSAKNDFFSPTGTTAEQSCCFSSKRGHKVLFKCKKLLRPPRIRRTRRGTIWIAVAIGTNPCNHRYPVTIDTKALFHVTHYSLYAVMVLATATWVLILHHPPSLRNSLLRPNPSLPESEAGPEAREVAAAALSSGGLAQAEEGVTLDGALPQVFAALGAGQLEHKRVLLFPTLDPPKGTKSCQTACLCVFLLASRTRTWSSSSTTTSVSRLFLKSSRVILGLGGQIKPSVPIYNLP